MNFYSRMEETARRLIDEYGRDVTVVARTRTGPAHDPTVSEKEFKARYVETTYSLNDRSETLIQVGDKMGIMSPDVGEVDTWYEYFYLPLGFDFNDAVLRIDGVTYQIIDMQPLNPGGTVLLYEFQARQ